MPDLGPVSEVLAKELTSELRRQGVVVWLDKDSLYTEFVDSLAAQSAAGEFPFPVVGFRKSFLELLIALDTYGSGLDKEPLLIHLPGFNEDSVRRTPVLEMYEPGVRFRKALDTLVREAALSRVAPAEVEKFLTERPTLQQADEWLARTVSRSSLGLEAVLEDLGPTLIVQAFAGAGSALHGKAQSPEELDVLRDYLHKRTGVDRAWFEQFGNDSRLSPLENLLGGLGAWLLCVEYVHDLKRPPYLASLQRLRELTPPLVKSCGELLSQLRAQHGDAYARLADEVESFVGGELSQMTADDLGHIDTFREEENRVLTGAVEALRAGEWGKARAYCEARQGERSFWLQRDQSRRWAWSLVGEAAVFGAVIKQHSRPLQGARSLEDAVQRYSTDAYLVDRAQRRFEQKRLTLLEPRLPHFGPLQEVVGSLRRLYRSWADMMAKDFTAVCQEHGFLPGSSLRQRDFYEEVVQPITFGGEKVAVFVIDAFRFEMATELVEDLKGGGSIVDLKPRLAELPTITSVGMNALAPVAQGGKLSVAGEFKGFKNGEFTVRKPEDRARAMGARSAGKPGLLLSLQKVCDDTTAALTKKIAGHSLIVVHSKEIDDAGEANVGLPTFESSLRQIKAAWHHLQMAGVKQFVFTADHGFLLQDETTEIRAYGKKSDPSRRHVLDDHPRAEAGMVPVSLSSLGYEGLEGYLLLREDTAVFATGNPGATFVHGGNSPQERIIPVLTVTKKRPEGMSVAAYSLEAKPDTGVLGMHRIKIRLDLAKDTTAGLGFAASRTIDIGLHAPEHPHVRAVIKDVSGPGSSLQKGRIRMPLGEHWTEVFFTLEGPKDERARVEVHHPDNIERVRSVRLDDWFTVTGSAVVPETAAAPETAPVVLSWADAIEDEGFRRVFLHIDKHNVITEPEVTNMLGSPRAFRKFSLEFEQHVAKLPFRVRIDTAEGGKRYVKEGDK